VKVRDNAILPVMPAADHSEKRGYFVELDGDGHAALCNANTDRPFGLIVDGGDPDMGEYDSIAVLGAGLSGTFRVKLSTIPGTVKRGTLLELVAGGTVKADTGSGSETIVAVALEDGAGDELIEAALLTASGTIPHQVGYNTSIAAESDGAVCGVTGQVTDLAGNPLAGRFLVRVWFGEAANDAVPHDFGDLAAQVGSVIMREIATDSHAEVLTAADGSWGVDITLGADDTVHANALVVGKVAVTSAAVDVP